jgi:hypothetical protein
METTTFIFTFLVIISLLLIYYRTKKRIDKKVLLNNLSIIYERMEIAILDNNIKVNDDIIKFLKSHKNILVNPEFADIQIIMALERNIKRNKNIKNEISINDKNIPAELHKLSDDFKTNFIGLVKLSMLRWSFIKTCLLCGTILFIAYIFKLSSKVFEVTNKHLGRIIKPNPYVVSVLTDRNHDKITHSLLPN